MQTICKVCGDQTRPATQHALDGLAVAVLPAWLSDLCLTCLYALRNYVEMDQEGYPNATVTPDNLNQFLAEQLSIMSRRAAAGLSIERCEAVAGYHYVGDPEDIRCVRFASGESGGRLVCGPHRLALKRGREVGFIGTGWKRAKPYLIWARDGAELMRRAAELVEANPSDDRPIEARGDLSPETKPKPMKQESLL